jgi:TonB family protein
LYGDKGKNGVILITSKNATEKNSKEKYDTLNVSKITSIIARKGINSGNPLIIVDGQEFKSMEEANVPTEDIANISVLKGETASPKIYGEKAKDGVIIINTKTKYNSDPVEITKTYKSTTKNGEYIFYKVDEMPEFPGGEAALRNFLANSVKYPEIAKENGIQGKVYITFIVTKEGKVTEPEIARGVDPSLDKEALRVVSSLPDWKPGKQHGQPVNVSYTVPITFALQNPLEKQTIFDLRSAIARSIKYPVVAQENNQQGVVEIWAFIAKDGTISRTTDIRPEGKFINIDEVVVTALKSEKAVTSEKSNNLDLLVKESKRVIEQLSPFKVPELLGEMVCFRIKFVLE